MKWKLKEDTTKEGALRVRRKFLLIPRVDSQGYWRWLEFAYVREEYGQRYITIDIATVGAGHWRWRYHSIATSGAV